MEDQDAPETTPEQQAPDTSRSAVEIRALYKQLQGNYAGRNSEFGAARQMYKGEHWGQPGLPRPPQSEKRYTLTANYVGATVDKAVQYMLGKLPAIQVIPPGVDEEARRLAEAQEAVLYHSWDCNSAPLVFRRTAFNSILLRFGYIYYWWDPKSKSVRFRSIAPDNFYPVYDGEEIVEAIIVSTRNTRMLRKQYPHLANQIRPDSDGDDVFDESRWARDLSGNEDVLSLNSDVSENTRPDQVGGQTTVLDWFDKDENHVRVMGEAVAKQRLNYGLGQVPVIPFPYNLNGDETEPRTEISNIIDLNLYLDDLLSDDANVIRKYARPTIIDKGSGVAPRTAIRAIQEDGGYLPIRKDAEIGFLTWEGTPPDVEEQYNRVLGLIYDLSGKPPSSYGQMISNQSGVATNMALSPTTASTEERQDVFGFGLIRLNKAILQLYEHFMAGEEINVSGVKPKRAGSNRMVPFQHKLKGSEMGGWRQNRVIWPSALRTDDPVYVSNELQKMQAQPPAQSVYTTLENLGIQDAEMELDRIKEQLADPRFHPDRLDSAVSAATALQAGTLPDEMAGLDPAMAGSGGSMDPAAVDANATAAGSPHKDTLVDRAGY